VIAVTATALKVGQLARRTGVSVRTLHYYDAIGLLVPSKHTHTGHRLYAAADVARLQQIVSPRQLGLSLEQVRECLDRESCTPAQIVEQHLARLREQIELQQQLSHQLERVATAVRANGTASVDDLIRAIEGVKMIEKYYTPEQLAWLEERRQRVGEERIREVEAEWATLIAEVKAEMERGTEPTSAPVLALARRWLGLVDEFTGGNPGIAAAVRKMWQDQPSIGEHRGITRELGEYVGQATQAVKRNG
jgi:DNA-binding transcriptional MerR regulator